jgi:translation initiation factor IF-2
VADKLRVHHLATQLGVGSKDILHKCRDEDLELKNHMSTVSAGLAATIREWFSEGSHETTVESTERVDLKKVRTKRRPRKTAKKTVAKVAVTAEGDVATATAVETAEPVEPPARSIDEPVTPAEVTGAPAIAAEAPATSPTVEVAPMVTEAAPESAPAVPEAAPGESEAVPDVPAEVLEPAAKAPTGDGTTVEAPVTDPDAPAESEPAEPTPIVPAGPQNVPAPAELQGPRVIRVEAPDPVYRPPRPGPRPPARRPGSPQGRPGPMDLIVPPTGGPTGRRGKQRGGETPDGEGGDSAKRKGGNRSRVHPRRSGRGSESVGNERLREWRDRDLEERKARLLEATERGLHSRRTVESRDGRHGGTVRRTKATVTEPIILHEFCSATGLSMRELFPKLREELGTLPTRNMALETELAESLAMEFGITLEVIKPKTALEVLEETFAARERKQETACPPVVTFLGHVDHGKTSLLDAIRQTQVADGESGGITQHIGAYRLERDGHAVTFLDTPGHEAFTAMRARGAQMTNVVVLVVAVDDGVMPQTAEAINHAKAANVPIVVALNKIDIAGADVNRVYGQLAEHQLVPTEWGGETDVVKTSATTGEGIDDLVEHLSTLSELLELKADPTAPARGSVIEAEMREGEGVVVRALVQDGTLKRGTAVVCGPASGRIRTLRDDRGKLINKAGPATPVEITGLDEVPAAGDKLYVVKTPQEAKNIAGEVRQQRRQATLARRTKAKTLEEMLSQRDDDEIPELNIIIKADVQGSADVLTQTLSEISTEEVRVNILHAAVGGVSESDVLLAEASNAAIVGFHVVADSAAQRLADQKGVSIRLYKVIYELLDHIRKALEGIMIPEIKLETRGKAEVREVFRISKLGVVAGCIVTEGTITRNHKVRLLRDLKLERDDSDIASLKRFKDDAKEVRNGMECGIRIAGFDDVHPGDVIEAYEVVEIRKTL